MGVFDWFKKKPDVKKIDCGPVTLTCQIVVNKNPTNEKIAALHREATTHKDVNWLAAVECLKEAAALMRQYPSNYVLDRWTRLPVFMQQAGQFDEAMQEFERLLSEVETRVRQECLESASVAQVEHLVNLNYEKIYDKMRMVCKRQKLPSAAAEYALLSDQYGERVKELRIIVDRERKEKLDKKNTLYPVSGEKS